MTRTRRHRAAWGLGLAMAAATVAAGTVPAATVPAVAQERPSACESYTNDIGRWAYLAAAEALNRRRDGTATLPALTDALAALRAGDHARGVARLEEAATAEESEAHRIALAGARLLRDTILACDPEGRLPPPPPPAHKRAAG